jgi:carbonic anhydrase
MSGVKVIDITGVETLLSIHHQLSRQGIRLILSEPTPQTSDLLLRRNVYATLGEENIFKSYAEAVVDANYGMLTSHCGGCANIIDLKSDSKTDSSKGCALARDMQMSTSLMATLIQKRSGLQSSRHTDLAFERILAVESADSVPAILRNTPIDALLRSHNLGEFDIATGSSPELIIGKCIDYRKSLRLPRDWAYILRREGANMHGAEFAIALGLTQGIKYMALIAHNSCAMANVEDMKERFLKVLVDNHGWDEDLAEQMFIHNATLKGINNEIDFVLGEAKRIRELFTGLVIVPMLYRVEDDRLYLIRDWLEEQDLTCEQPIGEQVSRI